MEPTLWTPRMVQALENGVKGGVWLWPDNFFEDLGLFSMARALVKLKHSPRG